jgi:hypothetical protein
MKPKRLLVIAFLLFIGLGLADKAETEESLTPAVEAAIVLGIAAALSFKKSNI